MESHGVRWENLAMMARMSVYIAGSVAHKDRNWVREEPTIAERSPTGDRYCPADRKRGRILLIRAREKAREIIYSRCQTRSNIFMHCKKIKRLKRLPTHYQNFPSGTKSFEIQLWCSPVSSAQWKTVRNRISSDSFDREMSGAMSVNICVSWFCLHCIEAFDLVWQRLWHLGWVIEQWAQSMLAYAHGYGEPVFDLKQSAIWEIHFANKCSCRAKSS